MLLDWAFVYALELLFTFWSIDAWILIFNEFACVGLYFDENFESHCDIFLG